MTICQWAKWHQISPKTPNETNFKFGAIGPTGRLSILAPPNLFSPVKTPMAKATRLELAARIASCFLVRTWHEKAHHQSQIRLTDETRPGKEIRCAWTEQTFELAHVGQLDRPSPAMTFPLNSRKNNNNKKKRGTREELFLDQRPKTDGFKTLI